MRWVVSLIALQWVGVVSAACPIYADFSNVRVQPALQKLAPQMRACAENSVTTGVYGGLLLRNGQVGEALIWLEKSLLLDPEQPGVAADYALALASVGESDASSALAKQVLSRDDVPLGLDALLNDLVRVSFWDHGFQFSVGMGVSDNILLTPDLDTLELTFGDDGRAFVPLTDPSIPIQRSLTQNSVQWSGHFSRGDTQVAPRVTLSERRASGDELADYRSLAGELRVRKGASSIGLGAVAVTFGGDQDRDEWFVEADRVIRESATCQSLAGVRYQSISYAQSIYDGQVAALTGETVCANGWEFQLEYAVNHALNARAGGDKTITTIAAARTWPFDAGMVQLAARLTQETDSEPYSDFLARGAPRTIDTFRIGGVWEVPLSPNWTVSSQVTHLRQTSNINLFEVAGSEIVINMIYTP